MTKDLRIGMLQINLHMGDLAGNSDKILAAWQIAASQGAEIVVAPELAICGYPPEDLLLCIDFLEDTHQHLEALRTAGAEHGLPPLLIGAPLLRPTGLVNSLVVLDPRHDGALHELRHDKQHLPNYAVFDERRYFRAGGMPTIMLVQRGSQQLRIGLTVCEDLWIPDGPLIDLAAAGCDLVINASASPYHMHKPAQRTEMLRVRARDHLMPIVYCNMVGGQDELVFDGSSIALDEDGYLLARGKFATEDIIVFDMPLQSVQGARLRDVRIRDMAERRRPNMEALDGAHVIELPNPLAACDGEIRETALAPLAATHLDEIWGVLKLGLRDYVTKNGFGKVLIGVSGGIDSALCLRLAVDALGAGNVIGVTMPSVYNSAETLSDAHALMQQMGVEAHEIPIRSIVDAFHGAGVAATGLASENIQSRIRGSILMSLSNERGALVLACGNKSEYAVGYATLYGDTCGGYAPLRDVSKSLVFALSRDRHELDQMHQTPLSDGQSDALWRRLISRPPSAELAPDQADTDSLPAYEILDPMLERIIERDESGLDKRVERLVRLAEYKRRQAPPGPRITAKAFGRDRRMPITNAWES